MNDEVAPSLPSTLHVTELAADRRATCTHAIGHGLVSASGIGSASGISSASTQQVWQHPTAHSQLLLHPNCSHQLSTPTPPTRSAMSAPAPRHVRAVEPKTPWSLRDVSNYSTGNLDLAPRQVDLVMNYRQVTRNGVDLLKKTIKLSGYLRQYSITVRAMVTKTQGHYAPHAQRAHPARFTPTHTHACAHCTHTYQTGCQCTSGSTGGTA
jgi:hypothetical protein